MHLGPWWRGMPIEETEQESASSMQRDTVIIKLDV